MTLLETGKIVTTHGVRGEVRAEAWSDSLEDLLDYPVFYTKDGRILEVERSRVHRGAVNLKFKGYDDIDSAMALIGAMLYIDKDAVSLPEGTYFVRDLQGAARGNVARQRHPQPRAGGFCGCAQGVAGG